MKSLSESDISRLLEFLGEIYSIGDLQQFRSCVVASLPKLIRSDVTGYNEVDTRRQRLNYVGNPPDVLNFPDAIQIFEKYMHEHPLIAYHTGARDPRVLKISDFLSRSRFHRLGLYQEFFRRIGVEFQMACVLPAEEQLLIGIALNRSHDDFTEKERILLALLRPHLMQAYRNAAALTKAREELAAAQRGLNEVKGQVILGSDGRTRWIAPGVHRLLEKYFGRMAGNGRIPDSLKQWVKHQAGILSRLGVPQPLVIKKNGTQLTVRMLSEHHRIVLLLEEEPMAMQRQALPAMGLSARESEVLGWVRGKSNCEIATILTMSARTVEKHLEHIFQKLGVESRTAAAARFWEAGHQRSHV